MEVTRPRKGETKYSNLSRATGPHEYKSWAHCLQCHKAWKKPRYDKQYAKEDQVVRKIKKLNKLMILLALLALAGCKQRESGDDLQWRYMKSPLSGRCYEVAQGSNMYANNAVLSMSEVPCAETKL